MKILPAISVLEGQVVEVKDGSYYLLRDEAGEIVDPRDLLLELKKEFGAVHILDIDGIENNAPNLKLIQRSSILMPIWAYAGSRDIMGMMDVLVAGVSKVIVGTRKLHDLGLLEEAHEMTANIVISFDHDSTLISPSQNIRDMGIKEMARRIRKIGVETAIFFDQGRMTNGGELNRYDIRMLQEIFEEIYVAGITSPSDIDKLAELDVSGVIVDFKSLREWGIEGNPDDWDVNISEDHSSNIDEVDV